jgi:hypothetical protein
MSVEKPNDHPGKSTENNDSVEKQVESSILYNEALVEKRVAEIYADFLLKKDKKLDSDAEIYRKVLMDFKSKYQYSIDTKEQREKAKAARDKVRKSLEEVTGVKVTGLDYEEEMPTLSFDRNTTSLAYIKTFVHPGEVYFNPKTIAKAVVELAQEFRRKNIPVDFDLVYMVTIKVLIHELLHKEGDLGESPVTEAVLESISYVITRDFLERTGNRMSKDFDKIFYFTTNFGMYANEINLFHSLLLLVSEYSDKENGPIDIYNLRRGFGEMPANFSPTN